MPHGPCGTGRASVSPVRFPSLPISPLPPSPSHASREAFPSLLFPSCDSHEAVLGGRATCCMGRVRRAGFRPGTLGVAVACRCLGWDTSRRFQSSSLHPENPAYATLAESSARSFGLAGPTPNGHAGDIATPALPCRARYPSTPAPPAGYLALYEHAQIAALRSPTQHSRHS